MPRRSSFRMLMRRLLHWLDTRPRNAINGLALLGFLLIGALDYATPPEIATSVFYLVPIAVGAWFAGRGSGLVMALLAAGAWMAKDIAFRGIPYAEQWMLFWNTSARLFTFSLVAWLIAEVRLQFRREQHLARTDALTGLLNARAFHGELCMELARAGRTAQPFSFAYLDLDDFKLLNDERGHAEGDRALATVADVCRRDLRRSDVVGRLGGDEFAVILPATDASEAQVAVSKLRDGLKAEMRRQGWPVGLSIGVITCLAPPRTPDDLVRAADQLMYRVKTTGKDAFLHRVWPAAV